MKDLEEKTISEETIFKGRVVELSVADVRLPNGKIAKRELIKHPGAVGIIPITHDGKIVMVEQYRKPLEKTVVEIPAGKMEVNEPKEETAQRELEEETAQRELEEETGYKASGLELLTSFYTAPGFADEIIHIYVARGLHKQNKPLAQDDDEFINVLEVTLDEAKQLIEEASICDAKTMFAIQYLELEQLKAEEQ
ncbi:NUDIX domain-containing protein [Listeria sp. ILCC797]|uniref:NUDIX domain-containing protein n=1 Tax=Listeria sp. ILCC797 TaxID=1918333 RepID=UPI000B588E21|nr:NUDIX hydrolase [Listeria sp. ILCC797]